MKKLTKDQVKKMITTKGPSEIILGCSKLKVDESIFCSVEEYFNESPMIQYIGSSQNNGYLKRIGVRISVRSLRDGSGWILTRIK